MSRARSQWAPCVLHAIMLVMSINSGWRIKRRRYAAGFADAAVAAARSSLAWGCIVGVTHLSAGRAIMRRYAGRCFRCRCLARGMRGALRGACPSMFTLARLAVCGLKVSDGSFANPRH